MNLSQGKIGDVFIIQFIDIEQKIKQRLQDMGLTQGSKVKIMSYYASNAFVLNIRGSRVVIGKDIAENILVEDGACNHCERKRPGAGFRGKAHKRHIG